MRNNDGFEVLFYLVLLVGIVALNMFIGGSCLQYCLDFWSFQMTHVAAHAPFWPCAFVSLFLGEIFIGAAILTWIISFFI